MATLNANTYLTDADFITSIAHKDTDTTKINDIIDLINSATTWIDNHLKFQVLQKTVSKTWLEPLATNTLPVIGKINSITSLKIDGISYTENVSYFFNENQFQFLHHFYPAIYKIELSYSEGWAKADIPADIIQACKNLVTWNYGRSNSIGARSRTVGDSTTEFLEIQTPKSILDLLKPYKS